MNNRKFLIAAVGLTAMFGGLSTAYAAPGDTATAPVAASTTTASGTAASTSAMTPAKAGPEKLAQAKAHKGKATRARRAERLAMKRDHRMAQKGAQGNKLAQSKAVRKDAKPATRAG
jgi:hypothetical protein